MRGVAFLGLFILITCASGDAIDPANASSELRDWRTATGKPPSKNEFSAVVAACEDRAKNEKSNTALEGCLAEFGLHRVQ